MDLKAHWMADLLPQMPEGEFQDLKEDIAGLGQLEPILVFNGEILDGRHRYRACKELGIEPWVQEFEGGMSLSDVIRSLNVYRRHLTASQRAMVAAELIKPYEEQARQKQVESGKEYGKGGKVTEILPEPIKDREPEIIDITPPEKQTRRPEAVDMAAEDWGVSGRSVRDAKVVVQDGTDEEKESVKTGKSSVSSAAKQVRERVKNTPKKDYKPQFNQTNDNIEWAKWTWNPVTGCKHGCPYCYARDIANRFYDFGFEPHFWPERLSAPQNTKLPIRTDEGWQNVFVSSMGDLFGEWVDAEWIESVLDAVRNAPQWNFIFLTKNPERLVDIEWPENAIVGTTVDRQDRVDSAVKAFSNLKTNPLGKFLSCEPLLEELDFKGQISVFDWVIIGGLSKSTGGPGWQPPFEWVESLHNQARTGGCAVYWKPNLKVRPVEYPDWLKD